MPPARRALGKELIFPALLREERIVGEHRQSPLEAPVPSAMKSARYPTIMTG